ncbi:hypothetical protein AB0J83_37315 [Actinoplanes sp. NPDC049596]|uniref:hypothetical protein n=1 Tax=unclassified Actinoplanes TaxID=2626549 RepID=UPI00342E3988
MDFPVEALGPAVAARAGAWARLGVGWRVRPVTPNHGKPMVAGEFESATWTGHLLVWVSGEAELDAVRLDDERVVSKHYDLAGPADLEVLLGELDALLAAGRLPDAAAVTSRVGPESGRTTI